MTKYIVTAQDRAHARKVTDRLKVSLEDSYELMLEAYMVKAWVSLDYKNWREWAMAEFDVSQSRAYQLLHQAAVVKQLREAFPPLVENVPVSVTEREARDIEPLIGEVIEEAQEQVAAGVPAQEAVRSAVQSRRQPVTRSRFDDDGGFDNLMTCAHEWVCKHCNVSLEITREGPNDE